MSMLKKVGKLYLSLLHKRDKRSQIRIRLFLLLVSMILTFIILRVYLHNFPYSNIKVWQYNIHHLFTGMILLAIGGIPIALIQKDSVLYRVALVVFGSGLAMSFDEWIYLIVTNGTDIEYILPVSFWGGLIMVSLACVYSIIVFAITRHK